MTLKKFREELNRIAKENPKWDELDVVYSADDEGSSYQKVNWTGTPAQFHDMKEYSLEIVGQYTKKSPDIAKEDVNAIIIN